MATIRRMRPAVAAKRGESERAAVQQRSPIKVKEERGHGHVSTQVKDRNGPYYATDQEVDVLNERFTEDDPPAYIRVNAGLTINMDNYESLRIDCSVSLPCHRDRLEEAYQKASDFVADKISQEQTNWLGDTSKMKGKGR